MFLTARLIRMCNLIAMLSLLAGTTARGHEAAFEVASVKVNTSDAPVSRMSAPEGTGRFEATNASVRMLILNAYNIPAFQLTGGPSWIDSLHVDILARGREGAWRAGAADRVRQLLCTTRMTPFTLNAGGMTMARLAQTLSGIVERVVTDETQLAGGYDLQLSFTPERPAPPGALPPPDPDAPSIFAALQEQLGLELDARCGQVDMVVIDPIDQPTEN